MAQQRLAEEPGRGGREGGRIPLYLTPPAAEALERLQSILRTDVRLYHDVELTLARLQRGKVGPLTEALAALVGKETSP
jgi:hypothetical protein